jgi:ankyrin repeat protein
MSLIAKAIMNDDSTAVIKLIENGAPLEERHMILAAANGCSSIIDILVANGLSVNVVREWGNTPLMYASMGNLPGAVQTLLKHGADIHKTNQYERNAYWFACDVQAAEVVNLLLSSGARRLPDSTGRYPEEIRRRACMQCKRGF